MFGQAKPDYAVLLRGAQALSVSTLGQKNLSISVGFTITPAFGLHRFGYSRFVCLGSSARTFLQALAGR
jgi:hypothetical protein